MHLINIILKKTFKIEQAFVLNYITYSAPSVNTGTLNISSYDFIGIVVNIQLIAPNFKNNKEKNNYDLFGRFGRFVSTFNKSIERHLNEKYRNLFDFVVILPKRPRGEN